MSNRTDDEEVDRVVRNLRSSGSGHAIPCVEALRTALRAKEQECGRLRAFVQAIADGGNLGKPVPEGVRYSAECLLKTSDAALRPPAEGEEE